MKDRRLRSAAKEVLRLGVVASMVSMGFLTLMPGPPTPTAEASVTAEKKDSDKDKKDAKHKDDDRGEDFVLNGQVLAIDDHKNPPEMIVGTVDGRARVRVLKTDEIALNGVEVGDFVELTGEKINELLFEATEISVGERASAHGAGGGSGNDNSADEDGGDEGDSDGD
jgi:hypothetical protein